jgi:hypothetical protein
MFGGTFSDETVEATSAYTNVMNAYDRIATGTAWATDIESFPSFVTTGTSTNKGLSTTEVI